MSGTTGSPSSSNGHSNPRQNAAWAQRWGAKWALVTGASAGIGLALAEQLAASGANLVLTARRSDRLEALAARLRSECGIEVHTITADLAEPSAPQQLLSATEGSGLTIDILINNA